MLRRIPKQLQSCLQTILEGVDVDSLSLLRLTSDVDPVRLNYFGSAHYALHPSDDFRCSLISLVSFWISAIFKPESRVSSAKIYYYYSDHSSQ